MIAGDRLVAPTGGGSATAGARMAMLSGLPAGSTAAARLVARSGLGTATAGVHLMFDPAGGPTDASRFAGFIANVGKLMGR